jgi:hypothetical protein
MRPILLMPKDLDLRVLILDMVLVNIIFKPMMRSCLQSNLQMIKTTIINFLNLNYRKIKVLVYLIYIVALRWYQISMLKKDYLLEKSLE